MATTLMQIRVDTELKKEADGLFRDLGLDTSTVVRMFLKQALSKQALPFKVQKAKKELEDDDFYNETNVRILERGYKELLAGKGFVKELINE